MCLLSVALLFNSTAGKNYAALMDDFPFYHSELLNNTLTGISCI